MTHDAVLNMRIDAEIKRQIEQDAKARGLSMGQMVRHILKYWYSMSALEKLEEEQKMLVLSYQDRVPA